MSDTAKAERGRRPPTVMERLHTRARRGQQRVVAMRSKRRCPNCPHAEPIHFDEPANPRLCTYGHGSHAADEYPPCECPGLPIQ